MRFSNSLKSLAAALVGLVLLSACVVVEEPGPGPGPRPGPAYCTREYQPVCGQRYGERRTFSNACLADRAGYDVVRRGECRNENSGPSEPRFCTREYRPVCAQRRGQLRTFGNACEADTAGWRVVGNGECR